MKTNKCPTGSVSLFFILCFILVSPFACFAEELAMPESDALVEAVLVRVIDGDTAVFDAHNIVITVRFIGVNAPEVGDAYSNNSTDYLKQSLDGQKVFLEKDEEWLDSYGRSLYYVWMPDKTLLNASMLRDGAAVAYFYPPNLKYAKTLIEAQLAAIESGAGIWSWYKDTNADAFDDTVTQYVGNKKSLVLHKTTCRNLPNEKNRIYFGSYEEAVNNGYHNCGFCFKQ